MRHHLRRQALLLDHYWSRLRAGSRTQTPPDGLDPEIAELAATLSSTMDDLRPSDAFRTDLRARLQTQDRSTQNRQWDGWTGSVINTERQRRSPHQAADRSDGDTPISHPPYEQHDMFDRPRSRSVMREALALVASALLFILVGVVLTLVFQGNDDQTAAPVVLPTEVVTSSTAPSNATIAIATATVGAPTATATTAPIAAVEATIPLDGYDFSTNQLAIGDDAIWIPVDEPGEIVRIDPTTNEVVARVPVSEGEQANANPNALSNSLSTGLGITIVDGAVWVVSEREGALKRINPATNQVVTTIPLGVNPRTLSLPFAAGTLWVVSEQDQQVLRVDLASEQVVAMIDVPGSPQDVTVAFGAAWVTDRIGDEAWKIDPATNQISATIPLDGADLMASCACPRASQIVASADSLWVLRRGGSLIVRIDPETNEVIATIPVPGFPNDLVVDGAHLWVTTGTGALVRIDVATNTTTAMRPMSNSTIGLDGVAVGEGGIWITAYDAQRNPETGQTTSIQGWAVRLQAEP